MAKLMGQPTGCVNVRLWVATVSFGDALDYDSLVYDAVDTDSHEAEQILNGNRRGEASFCHRLQDKNLEAFPHIGGNRHFQ